MQAEATPRELGAKSWKEVLAIRWRISTTEAHRRLTEAALLGPRRALTGEPLAPLLPATAAAQSVGQINREHVEVICKAMDKVPGFVDAPTRAQIEVDLVRTAVGVGPKELKNTADRTLFLLDQDGPGPDEHERARKRGVSISKQRPDATTTLAGISPPKRRPIWEAIFARVAAPGMCNPDDEKPLHRRRHTPQAQIDNDHRSLAQRRHDAMIAIGRIALDERRNSATSTGSRYRSSSAPRLQDLESRAGCGRDRVGSIRTASGPNVSLLLGCDHRRDPVCDIDHTKPFAYGADASVEQTSCTADTHHC